MASRKVTRSKAGRHPNQDPVPPRGPAASARWLAVADATALIVFVLAGMRSHHEGTLVGIFLRNAIPLLVAWFVVAAVFRTYRRAGLTVVLQTWIVAVPIGLVARSLWVGSPQGTRHPRLPRGGAGVHVAVPVGGAGGRRVGHRTRVSAAPAAVTTLDMPDPGDARSFWLQEALAHDPGTSAPPLTANVVADVCIVGGGFAGLWTAVELARRAPSLCIALVERDICGGGASGRNGGFISSSWWDMQAICGLFGRSEGIRYAQALADAVSEIGEWLEEHDVDAWFHREGILAIETGRWQAAPDGATSATALEALGLSGAIRPLSIAEAHAIADSPRITAARVSEDGAIVQPARLARALRAAAIDRGVHIFERTEVTGLERSRPAVVRTRHGAIKADQVVLTVGAWAAGWPGFRRSFGVIADHMVVTEPIPDRLAQIGWTSSTGIIDGRDLLFYLRPTDDDRLAIGGGGLATVFGGRAGGRAATHDRRVAEAAARGLLWLFPQLEGVRFTHAWGGPIDQTPTFLPFFQTLEPGTIHAGLGFSGHGLAQTAVGGRILASLVLREHDEWSTMPVVGPPIARTPPEPFRYVAVTAAARALERGDRRADAGRSRGMIASLVGEAPERYRDRLVARGTRR